MIAAAEHEAAVAATIGAAEAAGRDWQVVVVGAGPAGAALAWRLAASGIRALLVDRHAFPREKVCGSCLSPRAVSELQSLGRTALPAASLALTSVRLAHRGRSVSLAVSGGRVISRRALDAHLIRGAAAAGCEWLPGVRVTVVDGSARAGGSRVNVSFAAAAGGPGGELPLRAERVVLATGLFDQVRFVGLPRHEISGRAVVAPHSRIGVGCILPPTACALPAGELVMAVGDDGYCGVVRLEDGRVDVAAAFDRESLAAAPSPAHALARLLAAAAPAADDLPAADAILGAASRATPPLTRHAAMVAGGSGRILRTGDAAGYVEPFTGEGIGWALAAARLAWESLVDGDGLAPPAVAAARHAAALRRGFGLSHARCRLVAAGVRRPFVVAAAVAAAGRFPWVARRLVPAVIGAREGGAA